MRELSALGMELRWGLEWRYFRGLMRAGSQSLLQVYRMLFTYPVVGLTLIIAIPLTAFLLSIRRSINDRLARLNVKGKHCVITGGSKGLGKAIACRLAELGASVTIIARKQKDLDLAVEEIKSCCPENTDQKIEAFSLDVCSESASENFRQMLNDACVKNGTNGSPKPPDWLFTCAGQAKPGMFVEQKVEDFRQGMDLNYMGTVNAVKAWVEMVMEYRGGDKTPKESETYKLVMCGSILCMFGLVGYSQYCPSKFALRGLTEVLLQELGPLGFSIHLALPGTILSPGFEEEQKRKPFITKKIEGSLDMDNNSAGNDCPQSPYRVAERLLLGLVNQNVLIGDDIIGDLATSYTRGLAPPNHWLTDRLKFLVSSIIFPIWKLVEVDWQISKFYAQQKSR